MLCLQEPPPPLVYEEGHLVSGTLEALTGLLVPTASSYPDRGFLFAFLLSSRLFILPHELLTQVLAACHAQQTNLDKPSTAKVIYFQIDLHESLEVLELYFHPWGILMYETKQNTAVIPTNT